MPVLLREVPGGACAPSVNCRSSVCSAANVNEPSAPAPRSRLAVLPMRTVPRTAPAPAARNAESAGDRTDENPEMSPESVYPSAPAIAVWVQRPVVHDARIPAVSCLRSIGRVAVRFAPPRPVSAAIPATESDSTGLSGVRVRSAEKRSVPVMSEFTPTTRSEPSAPMWRDDAPGMKSPSVPSERSRAAERCAEPSCNARAWSCASDAPLG
jgi:hypothetical protein